MNHNTITCPRCAGKRIFNFRRTHQGVPGLCFECNGKGTIDRALGKKTLNTLKELLVLPKHEALSMYEREFGAKPQGKAPMPSAKSVAPSAKRSTRETKSVEGGESAQGSLWDLI